LASRQTYQFRFGLNFGERRQDGFMAGFDAFRATVVAQRVRPRVALFSLASAPTAHARCADTEPVANLPLACARVSPRRNANPEIKR
jgi:hypothetical protein